MVRGLQQLVQQHGFDFQIAEAAQVCTPTRLTKRIGAPIAEENKCVHLCVRMYVCVCVSCVHPAEVIGSSRSRLRTMYIRVFSISTNCSGLSSLLHRTNKDIDMHGKNKISNRIGATLTRTISCPRRLCAQTADARRAQPTQNTRQRHKHTTAKIHRPTTTTASKDTP